MIVITILGDDCFAARTVQLCIDYKALLHSGIDYDNYVVTVIIDYVIIDYDNVVVVIVVAGAAKLGLDLPKLLLLLLIGEISSSTNFTPTIMDPPNISPLRRRARVILQFSAYVMMVQLPPSELGVVEIISPN